MTEAIARRVKHLRDAAKLSGAAVAERMAEHGVAWNRSTVAKLETGRRTSISVEELLALALALEVSPAMVIADPRAGSGVPISADRELDPWTALTWIAGVGRRQQPRLVEAALHVEQALETLVEPGAVAHLHRSAARRGEPSSVEALDRARQSDEARQRQALLDLKFALVSIRHAGAPIPPHVDRAFVLQRARELGVMDEYAMDVAFAADGDEERELLSKHYERDGL